MSLRRPLTLLSLLALVASLLALTPAAPARAQVDVTINEVRIDDPGADEEEFFELHGPASQSLDGYTYIVLGDGTGGSGVVEYVLDLAGQAIPADGFFVVATSAFTLDTADLTAGLVFENSDNVTHLLVENFSGVVGDDLDTNDDGVLDTTPWTAEADRLALIEEDNPPSDTEYHYGPPTVGPDGSFVPGHAYACADGSDTYVIGAFDPAGGNDTPGAPNDCDGLVINEVDADTPGNDAAEFIELFDGGAGSTALDGLVVVLYNGSSDTSYEAIDLDGHFTDSDGFFVIGNPAVNNVDLVLEPGGSGAIQNGADAVALYTGDATDFPSGTAVTATNLLDALVYDTSDADDAGLIDVLTPGQPQIDENGNGDKDNHSSSRCPDGGSALDTSSYTQVAPSPGAANACGGSSGGIDCLTPVTHTIPQLQGSGLESPLVGTADVVVTGIVVGDFQAGGAGDGDLAGFYVQDATGDGDTTTSDAIFVYDSPSPATAVAVGDEVVVRGDVVEFEGLTELGNVEVAVCSSGNTLPAPTSVALPFVDELDRERHEGMLVSLDQTLDLTEYFELDRFAELVFTFGEPQVNPTQVHEPGSAAQQAMEAANDLNRITLDDGYAGIRDAQNRYPGGDTPWVARGEHLRRGDTVTGVVGIFDQRRSLTDSQDFGDPYPDEYRVHPTTAVTIEDGDRQRPAGAPDLGGSLTVAAMNVLNYFATVDQGPDVCGPGANLDCRGADSAAELQRQTTKLVNALALMDADVVGLMEIQNDEGASADMLVDALNVELGGTRVYDAIDTGFIGTDAIKVAFIYDTLTVTPVGDEAILDEDVDPTFLDDKNRPALAQTFSEDASGEVFTAVVNHLKSKGSPCDDVGDPDLGDGAGNCNQTRTDAAIALDAWLDGDPTGSGDPDFLILGDLNSYAMEDPIRALVDRGWTDLVDQYDTGAVSAYGYVFDGEEGTLDYAMANADLADQATGAAVWSINADELPTLDYNLDFGRPAGFFQDNEFRSSDHDPVLVGLDLGEDDGGGNNGGGNGGGAPTDPPVDPTEPPVDPAEGASIREACDDDATCTSVTVSQLTFTAGNRSLFHQIVPGITATEALLASDLVFADALASGTLQDTRPLLLNDPAELEPIVLAELRRVGVEDVWILGGTAAVSQDVEDALVAEGFAVTRLAGATRLETAQEVAEAAGDVQPTLLARAFGTAEGTDPTQAFADSLAVGGWAADDGRSVLLTETAQLSGSTEAWLESSAGSSSTLVGGVAALAEAVADAVRGLGLGVDRVAGATRFETAVKVAGARGFGVDAPAATVIISEGQAEDAWEAGFTAAAPAAVFDAPILLANGDDLPQPTLDFLGTAVAADAEVVCLASQVACDAAIAAIAGTG